MNQHPTSVKSSIAAGLFGIFLGSFGAHDWYLGKRKEAIYHLALLGGSLIALILGGIFVGVAVALHAAFLSALGWIFISLAYLVAFGNQIWGIVEGIIFLVKGDSYLSAQGYTVAGAGFYSPQSAATAAAIKTAQAVAKEKPTAPIAPTTASPAPAKSSPKSSPADESTPAKSA